ncbi:zinc finger protein 654-like isoform X2 [Vanacampus margaritifer]
MAEEGSLLELEGLEKQLQSLLSSYSSDDLQVDSKTFCSDYCKLVEEYASRWQTPLPRLRILETALCHFTRASSSFTSSCDHVLRTLSSLALSVFELLLFFDEQDFHEEPLKHFSVKFQIKDVDGSSKTPGSPQKYLRICSDHLLRGMPCCPFKAPECSPTSG